LTARLAEHHVKEWLAAFDERGLRSAARRANRMKGIYDEAAPVPGVAITEIASEFLDDVRRLVHAAIESEGGVVKVSYTKRTT
jgi:hypothetical protein